MSVDIHPATIADRAGLGELLGRIENFTADEVQCAIELIDAGIAGSVDYYVRVASIAGRVVGYICFGPTPMTEGTYDLYWIASDPQVRGQGVGAALVRAMEAELRERGGRVIRVETSATEAYGATRGFYAALKYVEECRFRDFYKEGEDLVILSRRV
jgi:ribosomal protein S18 acetylase RimI-like enzyme